MPRRRVVVLLALMAVAGCDSKTGSPPDLVKTQRDAMDKAKGVEQTLQQSADRKRGEEGQK